MQHTENRQDKNTFIFHTQGWLSQIYIVALQQSKPGTLLIAAVLSCQSILHPFQFSAGGNAQPEIVKKSALAQSPISARV